MADAPTLAPSSELSHTAKGIRRNDAKIDFTSTPEAINELSRDINRWLEKTHHSERVPVDGKLNQDLHRWVKELQNQYGVDRSGNIVPAKSESDIMIREGVFGIRTARALDAALGRPFGDAERDEFRAGIAKSKPSLALNQFNFPSIDFLNSAPSSPKFNYHFGQENLQTLADSAAKAHSVRPELVSAVIEAESAWNPFARSNKGAMGLMQLMPGTAKENGVMNPFNPGENTLGGAAYLRQLLDRYGNNERLALAAYNAGPGAVDKYQGVPPFPETQEYVSKVLARADALARSSG